MESMKDRKIVLLKACKELLQKQCKSTCALNLLAELVWYDGAYCDGLCLLSDIEDLLAELED